MLEARDSDFVFVNLFRRPVGAPMRPDAVNELMTAWSRRAGLSQPVSPHQLRHAFASNVVDAGGSLDEIAELLGHVSMSSSQVYLHPDPARLRDAVDRMLRRADVAMYESKKSGRDRITAADTFASTTDHDEWNGAIRADAARA